MRVLRGVLLCVALVASSIPAMAAPPVFNGDVITSTMPQFNVKFYGAKGDGTTDDTTAFNNAITSACNIGGGTVFAPPGTYVISSTLTINCRGVVLRGAGSDMNHDNAVIAPTSALKWNGTSGGTIVLITGTSVYNVSRNGVIDLGFLSNNGLAAIGLKILSGSGGIYSGLFFDNFTSEGLYTGRNTLLTAEYSDTHDNLFDRISCRNYTNAGHCIYADGDATGNTSMNTFSNLMMSFDNGNAIVLNNADNNTFTNVQGILLGGGTATATMEFGASGYSNLVIRLTGAALADTGSSRNTIIALDSANGSPTPTIQTGAQLFYSWDNGQINSNSQIVFTGNGSGSVTGTQVYMQQDGAANPGLAWNVPSNSTNGFQWFTGGNLKASLNNAGTLNSTRVTAGGAFTISNGDIGAARSGSTGGYVFGSTSSTSGLLYFTGSQYQFWNGGLSASELTISASNGALLSNGSIAGLAHNICSSSSGIPCENAGSCAISSSTTCSFTLTVPATSSCTVTGNASDTTTGVESWNVSLATNTLTIKATVSSSQTSTAAGNVSCI